MGPKEGTADDNAEVEGAPCTLARSVSRANMSPPAAVVQVVAPYTQIGCMEAAVRRVLVVMEVRTGWRRIRTPVDDSQEGTKEAVVRSVGTVGSALDTRREVGDEVGGSQEAEARNDPFPGQTMAAAAEAAVHTW